MDCVRVSSPMGLHNNDLFLCLIVTSSGINYVIILILFSWLHVNVLCNILSRKVSNYGSALLRLMLICRLRLHILSIILCNIYFVRSLVAQQDSIDNHTTTVSLGEWFSVYQMSEEAFFSNHLWTYFFFKVSPIIIVRRAFTLFRTVSLSEVGSSSLTRATNLS
jgi:hypothetical protein